MCCRFLLLILFFLSGAAGAQAQSAPSLPYHPNSYHLLLPRDWIRPKLIKAITTILPQTLDPLKERDFCTYCTADYTVMLIVDSISYRAGDQILMYTNTISDSFPDALIGVNGFYAALRLVDSNGKALVDLRLVSPDELMSSGNDYQMVLQKPAPAIPYDIELIRTSRGTQAYLRRTDYTNTLQPTPVYREIPYSNVVPLLKICETRIYEIRRTLRRSLNAGPS